MMTNQPSTGLVMIQSYSTPLSDAALLHRHDSPGPYRVWAPLPGTVALEIDGRHLPMHRSADGWWTADRLMTEGELYAFIVDGEGPFPDPRSMWQPFGVHGSSQCIDHGRFRWSDVRWQGPPLGAALMYELHVGTFTDAGTFESAIERLDHLVDLGVTHIELMPVAEFSGARGWGYDGVALFAPHHVYGHPDDLKRLVDACHAQGLAVILDVVYNHFGPVGNYTGRFGPYLTDRYHTPWGQAVNFDGPDSDEVRRFFCENALMWLRDYHFDGLRLDAVHAIIDLSARHLLEQLAASVEELEATTGRHYVLIAESDLNDPRLIRSREAGGFGIDAQWTDDFHHALHSVLTGERSGYYEDFGRIEQLARALRDGYVYAGEVSPHRRRVHGRAPVGLPGWRFVVAAQNHDQIGNRARGERLSHLVSPRRLQIAAALLLTAPFVPLLFQGEEWAASTPFHYFTAHEDEALGRQVAEGRRREFAAFGWDPQQILDPQDLDTFAQSRLRWDERTRGVYAEMLAWHRALIQLRQQRPSLRDGRMADVRTWSDEERGLLHVVRGDVGIICNLSQAEITVDLPGAQTMLLASDAESQLTSGRLRLPHESVVLVDIANGDESRPG